MEGRIRWRRGKEGRRERRGRAEDYVAYVVRGGGDGGPWGQHWVRGVSCQRGEGRGGGGGGGLELGVRGEEGDWVGCEGLVGWWREDLGVYLLVFWEEV